MSKRSPSFLLICSVQVSKSQFFTGSTRFWLHIETADFLWSLRTIPAQFQQIFIHRWVTVHIRQDPATFRYTSFNTVAIPVQVGVDEDDLCLLRKLCSWIFLQSGRRIRHGSEDSQKCLRKRVVISFMSFRSFAYLSGLAKGISAKFESWSAMM